ncbi:MAG: DEAD/DEAH box helicase, partial [Actinobacteria bacterium]|nr:DEAD/DEAH box helicase [Actinomycetota bacterium]
MDEEQAIIRFLGTGTTVGAFEEDLHRRVVDVFSDAGASGLDRAVILRHLLRRWSLRDGRDVPVKILGALEESLRSHAAEVGLRQQPNGLWIARAWTPEWLETAGAAPDSACLAGTEGGTRFRRELIRADPFFHEITGFHTYTTSGQRAACRAVMTTPEGSTVIAMLPTGSGKTEIALCLAERSKFGLTIVIVPTVALAYDFERRFREHFAKKNPRIRPEELNFAWTGSTDETTRERFRNAIIQGQQRVLVTSPESMTRALRQTLLDAAAVGRLQGIVIDEAHLVTQWGRFFRPEFRTLADLRRDLLVRSEEAGYPRAITLLLSATLGAAEMQDLMDSFGRPGPCNPIVANALRSEPDIWISPSMSDEERASRVQDILLHCARPAILYVTKPDKAERWLGVLRAAGFSRVASVTGNTKAVERAAVLEGLRMAPGADRNLDLVVATSAFGLGIDYPHIRTVVHACLPETVDRWYQELGRGGRDGGVSAAFLLAAPGDEREAESLGVRVLSPDVARDRWFDIWGYRREVNGRTFVDLEGARGTVGRGDYNRRWNCQVVQGLIELGELEREQFNVEDLRELLGSDDVQVADWTAVKPIAAGLGVEAFWRERWEPWQRTEMGHSSAALTRIRDVSRILIPGCQGIAESYRPNEQLISDWGTRLQYMQPVGACGRCPSCRRAGVPVLDDPPPSPEQSWDVAKMELATLSSFVESARGVNGLTFVTYGTEYRDLARDVARKLIALGVRHLGGVEWPTSERMSAVLFTDEHPLSPSNLTPVSSFSFFRVNDRVSPRWLVRREKSRTNASGEAMLDILLVPQGSVLSGKHI